MNSHTVYFSVLKTAFHLIKRRLSHISQILACNSASPHPKTLLPSKKVNDAMSITDLGIGL